MAFLGGSSPVEVGLQLLLSPAGSNVVLRTACCSVGIVLPVYSTFKAIERKDPEEQQRCLYYWAAYGSFSIAEIWSDKLLYRVPMYYHLKFAFLVWLQLPSADGSKKVYMKYLRPFLMRHQAKFDYIIGAFYGEAAKFASSHKAEFQFAKRIIVNVLGAGNQMVRDVLHPMGRPTTTTTRVNEAIEAPPPPPPAEEAEDSDSGSEK